MLDSLRFADEEMETPKAQLALLRFEALRIADCLINAGRGHERASVTLQRAGEPNADELSKLFRANVNAIADLEQLIRLGVKS